MRSRVRRWIKRKCSLEYRDRDYHRGGFRQMLFELQEQWQRREVRSRRLVVPHHTHYRRLLMAAHYGHLLRLLTMATHHGAAHLTMGAR